MKTLTKVELTHLVVSSLLVSFVYSYPNLAGTLFYFLPSFVFLLLPILVQKKLCERIFKCRTEYRLSPHSSVFSLVLLFFGIKFPLFVYPRTFPYRFGRWGFREKRLTVPENGVVSLSASLTSLFLSLLLIKIRPLSVLSSMLTLSFLFPLPPFNGKGLIEWKGWLWFLLSLISLSLAVGFF